MAVRTLKRTDERVVLAEHGRWISIFRDDIKLLEQRLRGLERRLSVVEYDLAGLMQAYGRPNIAASRVSLRRLRRDE